MIERGILYLVDPTTNSMRQHVLTILKYLNRARYKPYLVVSEDDYLIEHAKKLNVDYIASPGISNVNKLSIGGICKHIEQFAEGKTINLIHSHGDQACYVGTQVAKDLSLPHVSTVHTIFNGKKKGFFSIGPNKVLGMADHIIAVSEVVKRSVEDLNGKVSLVYNGIEADRFAETLDTEHLFRELNIEKGSVLVGTITSLEPGKGTEYLLEATPSLVSFRPDMHLIIVGGGTDLENLKKKAANMGLVKRTHFLGFRRDVAHILKSLDVVVIPNTTLGLPMILLEALASIKPVVVTDVPGVREAVAEDCVEFIPPKNTAATAEAIKKVLSNRFITEEKARTGQKLVKEKFSIQQMMRPTESLYLKVAK